MPLWRAAATDGRGLFPAERGGMAQPSLFDEPPDPIWPHRTYAPAEAAPRLNRHCRMILERLREGRTSLEEMTMISRNHTARISELRRARHDVRCVEHDYKTGWTSYALFVDGVEVGHKPADAPK